MSGESGLPLERFALLPLDVTTPHLLNFPIYKERVDPEFESTAQPSDGSRKPPLQHFTSSFLERTREIMVGFGKDAMELHDPVALWFVIENPPDQFQGIRLNSGWRSVRRTFAIERTGELTRGMCVVDRREDASAYAPGVNRAHVQAEINRHQFSNDGEWESTAVPALVEVEDASQARPRGCEGVMGGAAGVAETAGDESTGIPVVVETPGPETIQSMLLRRVWGVKV